jgi:hypothetical protein
MNLVVPKKMRETVAAMNALIEKANRGDKAAQKILSHAHMYGTGWRKISAKSRG